MWQPEIWWCYSFRYSARSLGIAALFAVKCHFTLALCAGRIARVTECAVKKELLVALGTQEAAGLHAEHAQTTRLARLPDPFDRPLPQLWISNNPAGAHVCALELELRLDQKQKFGIFLRRGCKGRQNLRQRNKR